MSNALHIITPVKDSIESTIETIASVTSAEMSVRHTYTIYNDNSTPENTAKLHSLAVQYGFNIIDIADLTDHPSPNYLLVLQDAQRKAIGDNANLLIIESDVTVGKDTIQELFNEASSNKDCGIAASVTVDGNGMINYPYEYARGKENQIIDNKKHCSFCCSLLTLNLLKALDFNYLNPSKNWYDVTISHESLNLGFKNLLFTNLPVTHKPHCSRPWKQLKYKNPLKYYWIKLTKGLDKI